MSQRTSGLLVVVVLGLLLAGSAQAQIQDMSQETGFDRPYTPLPIDDDDDDDDGDNGIGFGKRIAGTWMGMGAFDLDLDCDGVVDVPLAIPARDLHTMDVGGSYLVTTFSNFNTTHGTWAKTGPRQLTSEAIGFIHNGNCVDSDNPPDGICNVVTGPLSSLFSIKTVLDFDEDYQNATTSFGATVYNDPSADPLDPEAVPSLCTIGWHDSFKKVNVPLH